MGNMKPNLSHLSNLSRLIETMSPDLANYDQKVLRSITEIVCDKLALVTRAEFDAQITVLKRTQKKIDQLESEIESLRERITSPRESKE
ncbi:MAG: BMFP domain-containing protein YqiC [Cellvibrionaceae bacterium]|jgi:BMFP domain-containing protein YqiC